MIENKPKKCKGINKAKNFHGCGVLTKHRRHGLCNNCYLDFLLNTPEGEEIRQKAKLTGKRQVEKKQKAESKARMKKMKENVTDWGKKLQSTVNKIAKSIDRGLPCIVTEKHPNQMHAGHVLSRGSNYTIRYNLHNIHRQSAQSNYMQSDDAKMREQIIREYGEDYMQFILELQRTPRLNYKNYDFMKLYRYACQVLKRLEEVDKVKFTREERIQLRNKYNVKLAIYSIDYCRFKNQ